MAGDWIKMRGNLWDDPRVTRLVDETDSCETMVVGALYWLWATADQHSEDGVMPGLTLRTIDRKTGIKGLGDALVLIGWIEDHPEGVQLTRFDEHNGESAKRRCVDAKRKANGRKLSEDSRTEPGQDADDLRESSELEKEKEKEKELKPRAKAKAATASRLPADWLPTDGDAEYCKTKRPDLLLTDVADRFRDYWLGSGGKKVDWNATWRSWVQNERRLTGSAPPPATPPKKDWI